MGDKRTISVTKEKLLEIVDKGLNTQQAAKLLNCSVSTILSRSKQWSIIWKHLNAKKNIDKEELSKAINSGQTLDQVSKLFDCSKSTIWNICKGYNLSFPKSLDDSIIDMRRVVLNDYKSGAKGRDLIFTLTDEEFYHIVQQPCKYCGRQFTNIKTPQQMPGTSKKRLSFRYTGVDRINSLEGYTLENSVSCCKTCNRAKNNSTLQEFEEWIKAFVNYNKHYVIND